MENRPISIKVLADKLKRHPMLNDIPLETIVDYTVDFIQILGLPEILNNKVEVLKVEDYRAALPCDFIEMIQVRLAENPKMYFRYTTDSFHLSAHKGHTDLTYKIQGGVIFTSTKDKPIEISYSAIATDEDGFPLLPNSGKFIRAIESYIKLQKFTILFDLGKLQPQILQNIQQEYCWNVGACESEFKMISIDKAESLMNMHTSLLNKMTEHNEGFENTGRKELVRLH